MWRCEWATLILAFPGESAKDELVLFSPIKRCTCYSLIRISSLCCIYGVPMQAQWEQFLPPPPWLLDVREMFMLWGCFYLMQRFLIANAMYNVALHLSRKHWAEMWFGFHLYCLSQPFCREYTAAVPQIKIPTPPISIESMGGWKLTLLEMVSGHEWD